MAAAKINIARLKRYRNAVNKAGSGPLAPVFIQWGQKYLTWTRVRFKANSSGGGEWPALKSVSYRRATGSSLLRTKTGKRRSASGRSKVKAKYKEASRHVSILYDTGTLFKALTIKMPGNLFRIISNGIKVGFGGRATYKGNDTRIKDIAIKHQNGDKRINLPQRKIIHFPDAVMVKRMEEDLKKGLRKLGIII